MIELVAYRGSTPGEDGLRRELGGGRVTYLVATAALQGHRSELTPDAQREDERTVHLTFPRAVRWLMPERPLARGEQRVLLGRAADAVAAGNPRERLQLRHDLDALARALAELDVDGVDLADPGAAAEWAALWASPALGDVLTRLQAAMAAPALRAQAEGRRSFEAAARDWIESRPDLGDRLVLEGFTFLTDQQRHLVRVAAEDRPVVCCFAYRPDQPEAFAALRRTYAEWWPAEGPRFLDGDGSDEGEPESALVAVRRELFRPDATHRTPDGSLTLESFPHRHEEVAACIDRIAVYLADGRPAREIAVVTPRRGQYDSILQEEVALRRLGITVGVPPRLLLLTPLGRFALTLYQIWSDGRLLLTPEQFETILASGWLGARVRQSGQEFRSVKAQLFTRCRTREQWDTVIGDLLARVPPAGGGPGRLASEWLDRGDVLVWAEALEQVERLAEGLFAAGEQSIGGHVSRLLEALQAMSDEHLLESERRVVERIREALLEVGEATSLNMRPEEFGEVLTGLAREREEAESEEEELPTRPDRLWVTTPEGIDGMTRQVVILLGATSEQLPRPATDRWPRWDHDLEAHLVKERYYFLAVTRAAGETLHASHPKTTPEGRAAPSPYLLRLGPVEDRSPLSAAAPPPRPDPPARPAAALRDEYHLAELAHYALCPFRYKLERLEPRARRYREPFHVQILAQGRWIDAALICTEQQGATVRKPDEAVGLLLAAMGSVRDDVHAQFPGLRPLSWLTVEDRVTRSLEGLGRQAAGEGTFGLEFVAAPATALDVIDGDRVIEVDVSVRHAYRRGWVLYPITEDAVHEEWVLPVRNPEPDAQQTIVLDGTTVFASRAHAFSWWRKAIRTAFAQAGGVKNAAVAEQVDADHRHLVSEVRGMVGELEQGRFPKHPGEQCTYCAVRDECMGLSP